MSSSHPASTPLLVPIESAPGLNYSPDLATDQGGDDYFGTPQHTTTTVDRDELRKQRRKRNRRMYGGGTTHYHHRDHQDSFVLTPPAAGTPIASGPNHGDGAFTDEPDHDDDDDPQADEWASDGQSDSFPFADSLSDSDPDEAEQDGAGGGGEPLHLSRSELAGLVLANATSPLPLLAPYACAQLSPGLFVPLLALAGGASWLAATVIGIQGRYVGARSYPALASAVLPDRFRLHKLGELLASLFVLSASLVRLALGLVASSEIAVDLLVPERRRRDWERAVAVGVIGATWLLVPLLWNSTLSLLGFQPPSSSSRSSHRYTRLSTRSYSDLVPVASASSSSSSPSSSPISSHGNLSPPSPAHAPLTRAPPPLTATRRPRWSALLKLPAWSVAVLVWPIALLILGVRLKRLNRDSTPALTTRAKLPLIFRPDELREWDETQLWPAILLTFFLLMGTSHETFYYVTALRRPEPLAGGGGRVGSGAAAGLEAAAGGGGPMRGGGGDGLTDPSGGGGVGVSVEPNAGSRSGLLGRARRTVAGRRNQFPVAVALGLAGAFLIHLGWALVGTIGLAPTLPSTVVVVGVGVAQDAASSIAAAAAPDTSLWFIPTGNLLSDPRLPRADPYLIVVRILVWFAVVTQLEAHAHVGLARTRRLLSFFRPLAPTFSSSSRRRRRRQHQNRSGSSARADAQDDSRTSGSSSSRRGYRYRLAARRVLARVGFYSTAILGAWMTIAVPMWRRERHHGRKEVGGHGSGLVGLAEWSGVGIAGIGGCLVPALAYLVLFHLRRPRLILLSDPNSPQFSNDDLLQRKEREMQRRLSGRRIGTDVGVFGVLGPVGVVLVVRGLVAMIRRATGVDQT